MNLAPNSILVLIALLSMTLPSAGQFRLEPAVEIGWSGSESGGGLAWYRVGHFTPVTVRLKWTSDEEAPDWPARFNGVVAVDHLLDGETTVSTQAPILVEPGVSTARTVHIRSWLPLNRVRVRLLNGVGRELARWSNDQATTGGAVTWSSIGSDEALVLAVNATSLSRAGWIWAPNISAIHKVSVEPAVLPRSWIGWDGVSTVIFGGRSRTSPLDGPQRAALFEWVAQGGDLVVVAAADRLLFDELLAPILPGLSIGEFDSQGRGGDFGQAVRDESAALREAAEQIWERANRDQPQHRGQSLPTPQWVKPSDELDQALAEVESVDRPRRTFTLSDELVVAGWHVRDAGSLPVDDRGETQGDIVWGPYGSGSITVLGFDPASLIRGGGRSAVGAAWWTALQNVESLDHALRSTQRLSPVWSTVVAHDELRRGILNRMLNLASAGMGTSPALIIVLTISLGALAILIGPFDRLLFKKLKRLPLTWVTCPIWIGVASLFIIGAQSVGRVGDSSLRRVTLIDIPSQRSARCRSMTVYAIGSDHHGVYRLEGIEADHHLAPANFNEYGWRRGAADRLSQRMTHLIQAQDRTWIEGQRVPAGGVAWVEERALTPIPEIEVELHLSVAAGEVADSDTVESMEVDDLALVIQSPDTATIVGAWVRWDGRWWLGQGRGTDGLSGEVRLREGPAVHDRDSEDPWLNSWELEQWPDYRVLAAGLSRSEWEPMANLEHDRAVVMLQVKGLFDRPTLVERSRAPLGRDWNEVEVSFDETTWLRYELPLDSGAGTGSSRPARLREDESR